MTRRFTRLIVILFILVLTVLPIIKSSPVYAGTTVTFYTSSSDGRIYSSLDTWANDRVALSGTVSAAGNYTALAGGFKSGSNFYLSRGFLFFNTSTIPVGTTITSATLYLYPQANYSGDAQSLYITNGQPTYPTDPLTGTDFAASHYSGVGGQVASSDFKTGSYVAITLNATGISWINTSGWTKLVLVCSLDWDAGSPTQSSEFIAYESEQTGTDKDPYLSVTYNTISGTSTGLGFVVLGSITENQSYSTGLDAFEIQNTGTYAMDVTIHGTDMVGGTTWTLSDTGIPGDKIYALKAGLEGGDYTIVVKKSTTYNVLVSNLAISAKQKFGIKFYSPTVIDDSTTKTSTVTVTYSAH